jgi:5-(carboxyamino)imidazole ribonucleotide synthase
MRVRFAPGLSVIERLQDKLNQKRIFAASALPSSAYEVWKGSDLSGWIDFLTPRFPAGVVFKWSRMGYDGKGVLIVPTPASQRKEIQAFCEEALTKGAEVYAEEKIAFQRELAIVACHSTTGEFSAYPLVISEQQNGICKRVVGPASRFGAPAELMQEAHRCAEIIARATGIVGTFAIEFFEDENGRLLINEVAPRVHNSGHYTQDAAATSQFANHLRAVLGLPLGRTESHEVFAMFNLLGPEGVSLDMDPPILPKVSENIALHWYFKPEVRSRRKLGHLNASASDPNEFPNRLRELERIDFKWQESLKNQLRKPRK